jgi:hypothetical protein
MMTYTATAHDFGEFKRLAQQSPDLCYVYRQRFGPSRALTLATALEEDPSIRVGSPKYDWLANVVFNGRRATVTRLKTRPKGRLPSGARFGGAPL